MGTKHCGLERPTARQQPTAILTPSRSFNPFITVPILSEGRAGGRDRGGVDADDSRWRTGDDRAIKSQVVQGGMPENALTSLFDLRRRWIGDGHDDDAPEVLLKRWIMERRSKIPQTSPSATRARKTTREKLSERWSKAAPCKSVFMVRRLG